VRLPEGTNPALGELTVETSPSLAAGMRYSARFLDEFPYECIEQTVSRFLPRVVMQSAFDKLKLSDREGIAGRLPSIVQRSLQKLYSGQSRDGGWGWWPGESGDQWITAYAVQGLSEARRAGYTVDDSVLDRAASFLRKSLDTRYDAEHPENANSRAYVLYALALAGKGDVGLTNSLYDRRATLGNYGRAYLALAFQTLGASDQDGKVKSLISDLSSAAISSAAGSHWEEATIDYRAMNSNTRSTAVVLDALVRLAPDNPLIQPAVRWLMVARKEGHWETTQETAASLLALTDYLSASGELKGDFAYRVSLNGKDLATQTVTPSNVDEAKRLVVELKELVGGGDSLVNIARANPSGGQSGDGKLYYTMALRYFLPGDKVPAVAEGIGLIREYYRLGDEASGPVTQVAPGETVKVKLTMVALRDLHYFAVEDPLPSGLEAIDTRLKTSSVSARGETGMVDKSGKEGAVLPWWKYDYFTQVEPRDDRVTLFATYLPKGTYEYTYLAKATSQGEFQALPARGYEMYFPEVWGRSEGSKFTVR
ncbi:MAG TPA: alpha-2-macroglobulin, partial [Chloroflexota bacterium]|nr:alpha-2-macroglobulin [Chloroflexota bacterium]